MTQVSILLEPTVALFYQKVSQSAGKPLEQVLADALYLLAAELSMDALRASEKKDLS